MKILLHVTRARPWDSVGIVLCMLFAGLAEGLALSSLLPLFSVVTSAGPDGAPAEGGSDLGAALVAALRSVGIEPTVGALLVIIPVAFAVKNGLLLLARRQMGNTVAQVVTLVRLRLIRALLRTSWSFYVSRHVGSFAAAYTSEAKRSARAYLSAAMCVSETLHIMVYASIALATAWRATLGAALLGVAIALSLRGLVRMARRSGQRQTRLTLEAISRLTDLLQSVKPLKAMAREPLLFPHIERMTLRLEKVFRKEVLSKESLSALQETLSVAIVCVGFFLLWRVLSFPLNQVVLLAAVLMKSLQSASKLQRNYQSMVVDESAYDSLLSKIEEAEGSQEERPHGGAEPTLERGIEFRNLTFVHKEAPVFEGLSLEIPAAQITALTGVSGSGKTTLVDLLVGLYPLQGGEIRIDGRTLADLDLMAWRQQVGYVPQETFLLHDTVAMNVSLGDTELSPADIERALREARAWDFVAQLPRGIDSVVGERGSSISGGERQRVAIARALVTRPSLLILDEATANLDPASEAAVWQAMKELRGRVTVLAISHQPALADVADVVYRIEGGRAFRIEPGGKV